MNVKKLCIVLLAVFVFLAFSACASGSESTNLEMSVDWEVNGDSLEVIFADSSCTSGSIWSQAGVYEFTLEFISGGKRFTLTYPDGYVYTQTESDIATSRPSDYDENERRAKGYLSASDLRQALEYAVSSVPGKEKSGGTSPVFAILLLLLGVWYLFGTQSAWYLAWGWRYKNAEPSDIVLVIYRVLGVVWLVAGLIMVFAYL